MVLLGSTAVRASISKRASSVSLVAFSSVTDKLRTVYHTLHREIFSPVLFCAPFALVVSEGI